MAFQRQLNVIDGYDCMSKPCVHEVKGEHGIASDEWWYVVSTENGRAALTLFVLSGDFPESVTWVPEENRKPIPVAMVLHWALDADVRGSERCVYVCTGLCSSKRAMSALELDEKVRPMLVGHREQTPDFWTFMEKTLEASFGGDVFWTELAQLGGPVTADHLEQLAQSGGVAVYDTRLQRNVGSILRYEIREGTLYGQVSIEPGVPPALRTLATMNLQTAEDPKDSPKSTIGTVLHTDVDAVGAREVAAALGAGMGHTERSRTNWEPVTPQQCDALIAMFDGLVSDSQKG